MLTRPGYVPSLHLLPDRVVSLFGRPGWEDQVTVPDRVRRYRTTRYYQTGALASIIIRRPVSNMSRLLYELNAGQAILPRYRQY